ncbi:hypothetical protein [Halanaerobium saccharolyticum]|nr:hypothetical protein [Halanaerobium saccharolyticum]
MAVEKEHLKQAWHNTILSKELSDIYHVNAGPVFNEQWSNCSL